MPIHGTRKVCDLCHLDVEPGVREMYVTISHPDFRGSLVYHYEGCGEEILKRLGDGDGSDQPES